MNNQQVKQQIKEELENNLSQMQINTQHTKTYGMHQKQ